MAGKGAASRDGKRAGKFKRKAYEKRLEKLHVELVKLQEWVKHKGLKVCIVFEAATVPARVGRSRPSPSA